MCEKMRSRTEKQQIRLIGIGMGSAASMTREGAEAIEDSDCLIGARRMLEAAGGKSGRILRIPGGGDPVVYRGPSGVREDRRGALRGYRILQRGEKAG